MIKKSYKQESEFVRQFKEIQDESLGLDRMMVLAREGEYTIRVLVALHSRATHEVVEACNVPIIFDYIRHEVRQCEILAGLVYYLVKKERYEFCDITLPGYFEDAGCEKLIAWARR